MPLAILASLVVGGGPAGEKVAAADGVIKIDAVVDHRQEKQLVAGRPPIRQTDARIVGNWFGVKPDEIVVKARFFFGTGKTTVFFGSANLRRGHGGILPQRWVNVILCISLIVGDVGVKTDEQLFVGLTEG